MDREKEINLIRELLTSMIAGLLAAMKMTGKYDEVDIDVLFSPQVFNLEHRHQKRRYTFIINACITPAKSEAKDG